MSLYEVARKKSQADYLLEDVLKNNLRSYDHTLKRSHQDTREEILFLNMTDYSNIQ